MAYCPILATRAGGLFLNEDIQSSFRDVHAGNKQIALKMGSMLANLAGV